MFVDDSCQEINGDKHIMNLPINIDDAILKAEEYARNHSMSFEKPDREALVKLSSSRQQEHDAMVEDYLSGFEQKVVDDLNEGIMPIGNYKGLPLAELPIDYINWVKNNIKIFEDDKIMSRVAEAISKLEVKELPQPNGETTWGAKGERDEVDVTVLSVMQIPTKLGSTTLIRMVSDDGAEIVNFSKSFKSEVGDRLRIKATVKDHEFYKGSIQTKVSRMTIERNYTMEDCFMDEDKSDEKREQSPTND